MTESNTDNNKMREIFNDPESKSYMFYTEMMFNQGHGFGPWPWPNAESSNKHKENV